MHPQFVGRQRGWRGWRHRLAARRDQHRRRCLVRVGRYRRYYAGDAANRLARHPGRELGRLDMSDFNYLKAAVKQKFASEGAYLAGGMNPVPAIKLGLN